MTDVCKLLMDGSPGLRHAAAELVARLLTESDRHFVGQASHLQAFVVSARTEFHSSTYVQALGKKGKQGATREKDQQLSGLLHILDLVEAHAVSLFPSSGPQISK